MIKSKNIFSAQYHNFRPSIHKSLKYTSKNDIYKENQVYAGELKNLIFLPSTTISALVWHSSLKYPCKKDIYKENIFYV